MKLFDQFDHLKALKLVQDKNLYRELIEIVSLDNLSFGKKRPNEIKNIIGDRFDEKGWADKVKVVTSNLTISFKKSGIGVCFQIGNVARTYADILKLMALHQKGAIEVGAIIVPGTKESKILGANYASYERLEREIILYKEIIAVPLLVIGLSNN
jgi:hypothetical protein